MSNTKGSKASIEQGSALTEEAFEKLSKLAHDTKFVRGGLINSYGRKCSREKALRKLLDDNGIKHDHIK